MASETYTALMRCRTPRPCAKCGKIIPVGSPNYTRNPRQGALGVWHDDCSKPNGWNRKQNRIESDNEWQSADTSITTIAKFSGTCFICKRPTVVGVTKITTCADGINWRHTHCEDITTAPTAIKVQTATENEFNTESLDDIESFNEVEKTTIDGQKEFKPNMQTLDNGTGVVNQLDPITGIIWKQIEPLVNTAIGSNREIEAKVNEILKQLETRTVLEVRQANSEPVVLNGVFHRNLPELIKRISLRSDVYLAGPAGSWKSSSIKLAAETLGLRYGYIALSMGTMPSDIFGYVSPITGLPVETIFTDFYVNGGVLDIAELDNTNVNVFTMLNNALDNKAACLFGKMVDRNINFAVVGNGNTDLDGPSTMYPGRMKQDAASVERFAFIDWPYDETAERKLALAINPKCGPMIDAVQQLRKFAAERNQQIVISPRGIMKMAKDLLNGWTFAQTLDAQIWKNKHSIKKTLMPLVSFPTVDMGGN